MPTPDNTPKTRPPLNGIRVVDFSSAWAGPACTMLLADMGAEVIKIETALRPDITRRLGPWPGAEPHLEKSGYFATLCRGKQSLLLNLSTPRAIDIVKRLVAVSDAVVENYSPRVMGKLGVPYPVLKEVKPDLVMLSMSGYGATGPDRDNVSYGQTLEAISGLDALIGYPGGPPMAVGLPMADQVGGLMGAFALLAALRHRDATGRGQYIDLSQFETLSCLLPEAVMTTVMNGEVCQAQGNRDDRLAPHGLYRCQGDDEWVAIAVGNDEEWRQLCGLIGRPELADDQRYGDQQSRWLHQEEIEPHLKTWSAQHRATEAMSLLQGAGIPAGPCLSNKQLLADPHLAERGFFVETDHPLTGRRKITGLFATLSASPGAVTGPAPLLGQHTDAVLGDLLGFGPQQIEQWREGGVVV